MSKPPKTKRFIMTPQIQAEIRKLRTSGMHLLDIAGRFNIAKSTVERAVRGKSAPSGINTKSFAGKDTDTELEDIDLRIKELKERKKQLKQRGGVRARLLAQCLKLRLSRADLYAVAGQLPLLRITKKHREKGITAQ